MSDLKPCPLCGEQPKYMRTAKAYNVFCSGCGAEVMASTISAITTCQVTKQKLRAFDMWNNRAQPTIADYLEANKEMIDKTGCKVVTIASLKKFGGLDD